MDSKHFLVELLSDLCDLGVDLEDTETAELLVTLTKNKKDQTVSWFAGYALGQHAPRRARYLLRAIPETLPVRGRLALEKSLEYTATHTPPMKIVRYINESISRK